MNIFTRKRWHWCSNALCLQKVVAAVLVISFSLGLVHSDMDDDGIPNATDPFPEISVAAPQIISPYEDEVLYVPSREVTLRGTAESGSQIKLFEDGVSTELSCQEASASQVQGSGLLLSGATDGSAVDQVELLANKVVVAQAFYDTNRDSVSSEWRIDAEASWATETKDDAIDGICNYQAATPEDRCGAADFPEQVIALLTAERAYLFDAQLRTFWKSMEVSNATSIAAENGKIFVGTDEGVRIWDFIADDFTKTYTTELPAGSVTSLDTVAVGETQYLLVATQGGAAVINLATDTVLSSSDSGVLVGAAFTASNRVLWATATEVWLSDVTVDLLEDSWESMDLTATVRFPFDSPGTITVVEADLIGLTTGVVRIFDEATGTPLVQHVTQTEATLPMGLSARGHWLSTDGVTATDVSISGKDLDNVSSVTSVPAATGADLDIFEFGAADNYLQSQSTTDFSITGEHLTVGAWVRRPDFGGVGPFKKLLTHGDGSEEGDWDYFLSAGENFFGYGLNADPYYFGVKTVDTERAATAFTFALDTWQLLVGTYDAEEETLRIYLDGVEQDQNIFLPGVNPVTLSGEIATVDKDLFLGWGYDEEYFNGDMALPFIAEETYSPEQVELLHFYSNSWFAEDTTTTLRGTSNEVTDISCDTMHKECFVLTADGTITRIDGNLFAGGVTSKVADVTDIASITPTYIGTWQCTHAFDTSGAYVVFARTYWDDEPTLITSSLRHFTVYSDTEQSLGTPVIVPFPDAYHPQDSVRVLWNAEESASDYFVAEMATDALFQENVRRQISQGHSARFDALEDAQRYYFRVKAQNNTGGVSEWSDVISITIDISDPTTGVVVAVNGDISSTTGISFEWATTPFMDLGSGLLWYDLEVSTDSTFTDTLQRVFKNDRLRTSVTSYAFTAVQGKTYFARVRAMDSVGNVSRWAESTGTLVDTTAPSSFAILPPVATAGSEMRLQWSAATDPETGLKQYEIWKKGVPGEFELLDTVGPEIQSYVVTGLQVGTSFKIIAQNGAGLTTETADQDVAINPSILVTPQWLSSPYSSSPTVSLQWTADTDVLGATKYQVFRGDDLIGTVEYGTTTFDDPDVHASGEVFTYKIQALKEGAEEEEDVLGAFSEAINVLVDTTAPTLDHYDILGPAEVNTWRNDFVSLQLWGTDGEPVFDPGSSTGTGFSSGMAAVSFREGTTDPFQAHNMPILITESGVHDFQFQLGDRAGNEAAAPVEVEVKLDTIAPTVSLVQTNVSEAVFSEKNGFLSTEAVTYTITASDAHSGVDTYEISYRLDKNGDGFSRTETGDVLWTPWASSAETGTIPIPGKEDELPELHGILEIRAAVTDRAGNRSISDTFTVKIDRDAPALSTDVVNEPVIANTIVQLNVIDLPVVQSGTDVVYYTKDGSDPKTALFPTLHEGTTVTIEPGTDTVDGFFIIKYYAVDLVGNASEVHIATNNPEDLDADGLPDWWEVLNGGDVDPDSDLDMDSLTAIQEYVLHTDPRLAGTDRDSVSDGIETNTGTNPLDGTDHAFQWIAPEDGAVMKSTFTLLGTATPGVVAEVFNTNNDTFLGMNTVDPSGNFTMETDNLADGDYALKVQFQHPDNPLAVIESDIQNITVDNANAIQPTILNIVDDAPIGANTSRVLVSNVSPNATIELFEIIDNILYSVGVSQSTAEGTADLWLPLREIEMRNIFVLDQNTWKTSETITFEQGVFISGTIFANDNNGVLPNAIIKVADTIDGTKTVSSQTDGTYTVFIRSNRTYVVSAAADGYVPEQKIVTTAYDDVEVDLRLYTASSAPGGNVATGSLGVTGWSGRELENPEDTISAGWVPKMTYEESLEQVRRLNAGLAGQIKTQEVRGEDRFAGYISGRIGVEDFYPGEDSKKLGMSAFGDRVKELHASAAIGSCLQFHYTTMDFRDVTAQSSWYPSVSKMYSLGQMPLDENFYFHPRDVLSWETVLELTFAVRCAEPDTFELLRSFGQESLPGFPLQNTLVARRAYTALDMGLISYDTDLTKAPTREQILRLWMGLFNVPVNPLAINTSFEDVAESEGLAPILVAARKFNLIPAAKNFRPQALISRAEGAQWFLSFFEAEQDDCIDRTEMDQFDDFKVGTGREVTDDEQVRAALLQKEVAGERNDRIAEIVPLPDDLDTEGRAAFIRRQDETREEFLERLAAAKELVPTITLPDYEQLAQESLIGRGIIGTETQESKIQFPDTAGFIRRQDETREDFLKRLAVAKQELEEKKLALIPEGSMKASAPKDVAPTTPTQNPGQLKIDLQADTSCNVKMSWETDEMFDRRCCGIVEEEKTIYEKILDFFRKTRVTQETVEPVEVTIEQGVPPVKVPALDRKKLDVIFRTIDPKEEGEEDQTTKIETETLDSNL